MGPGRLPTWSISPADLAGRQAQPAGQRPDRARPSHFAGLLGQPGWPASGRLAGQGAMQHAAGLAAWPGWLAGLAARPSWPTSCLASPAGQPTRPQPARLQLAGKPVPGLAGWLAGLAARLARPAGWLRWTWPACPAGRPAWLAGLAPAGLAGRPHEEQTNNRRPGNAKQ